MTQDALVISTVTDEAEYTLRTRLDGADYNLHFQWNEREGRWYLSIADESDNPIVTSIKLITNWPLLFYYQSNPKVPPGELVVVDQTNDGSPPGISDLGEGQRCQLIYMTAPT